MAAPLLLPLLLSAAPGIISGVANLFDRKRRRREEQKASKGISDMTDVFKQNLKGNFMDTPEASEIIKQILQQQQEGNRAIDSTGAMMGLTDEAKIAMKGNTNNATAGALGGIAGAGTLWRDRQQQNLMNANMTLFDVGQTNRGNFNQSLQNILGPLQDTINTGASMGAFDDGINLFSKNKIGKSTGGGLQAGRTLPKMKNTYSKTLWGKN